jgi:hypothetical protein
MFRRLCLIIKGRTGYTQSCSRFSSVTKRYLKMDNRKCFAAKNRFIRLELYILPIQSYTTMEFPVELVELLKHTDVEISTWNLQVNVNVVTVRRTWINTDHTTATTGNVDIQASSTRTSNSQRLSQWKAERNQVVINLKAEEVHAQRQSLQPDRRHNTDWSTKQSWSEPDLPVKQYGRSTYTETITTARQMTQHRLINKAVMIRARPSSEAVQKKERVTH